jgi:catechol 2,3-dioxygenase-like lactoylglutathione lyase family enzyme
MIETIDHIDIAVSDVDTHVGFYETLGFRIIRPALKAGDPVAMQLPGDNQPILELNPTHLPDGKQKDPQGLRHLALGVDDIDAAFAEMSAKGLSVDYAPFYFAPTDRWLAAFRDPDGRKLQLVGPRKSAPA